MISSDIIFYAGAFLAGSGVFLGFYLLSLDNTSKYHIITLVLAISGITLMISSEIQMQMEKESNYQSLKPSLDMKPCAELEKTITFGMNQTMVDFSKRNYNERCL